MKTEFTFSMDAMLKAINDEVGKINKVTTQGLWEAGLAVERVAKKNVHVLTGNLRGSGYTRMAPDGAKAVEVGFYAAYAPYVHEMDPRPGGAGRKKFLEYALYNVPIVEIMTRVY